MNLGHPILVTIAATELISVIRMNMKITVSERLATIYQAERLRLQRGLDSNYAAAIEKKKIDKTITERVQRNIRLDLDKGRKVDAEC